MAHSHHAHAQECTTHNSGAELCTLPTVCDPFNNATHISMDAEVVRKTGGNPDTDDVALYNLLSYVDFDVKSADLGDADGSHLDTSIMLMLECRPVLKDMLRIALERKSFRQVRLLELPLEPRMQRSSRWLTISFIRQAQCWGNVHGPHVPNADMLTPTGEEQAPHGGGPEDRTSQARVGTCDPLARRAQRTRPSQAWRGVLPEGHEYLAVAPSHEHDQEHTHEAWRDEMPDGIGETYADVAARAVHYLLCLFSYHGAALKSGTQPPPDLSGLADDQPDDVPIEIPHIVVVAHNFILCELYEALLSWNEDGHAASNADFAQTGWSRHVLCLHGAERDAVDSSLGGGGGGRARLYGRLEQTILRHPDEYNPEACSSGESVQVPTPCSTPAAGTPHSSGVNSNTPDIPLVAA
ncbi:phosphoglycerate mutase-like protein [Auriculariales sp. MPI-PUGE-AT-0066]|nr:phosphoglycerate mutase-like protein [Auriculariales sp. MPI-PUGE-AT-0066]